MISDDEKQLYITVRNSCVSCANVVQRLQDNRFDAGYLGSIMNFTGSQWEGVLPWLCGDTDNMISLNGWPKVVSELTALKDYLIAVTNKDNPAYLSLHPSQNGITSNLFLGAKVISRTDGKESVYIGSQKFLSLALPYFKENPNLGKASGVTGPALGIDRDTFLTTCVDDLVPCLVCPQWPSCARHFITRHRPHSWPSPNLLKRIQQAGCQVVPLGHPESINQDVEWRWSFSVAERELIYEISDDMYLVMCILKAYKSTNWTNVTKPTVFCSYFIKTACLWVCEETDHINITDLCREVIDWLLTCCRTHEIPHYFIPEQNLIGHLQQGKCEEVIDWLKGMNHNSLRRTMEKSYFTCIINRFDVPAAYPLSSSILNPSNSSTLKLLFERNIDADKTLAGFFNCDMQINKLHAYFLLIPICPFAPSIASVMYFVLPFAKVLSELSSLVTPFFVPAYYANIHRCIGDLLLCIHAYHRKLTTEEKQLEQYLRSKIISHYTEGLEMVSADGWSDRGLGGYVRLATFYHLNGEREKLGETMNQLVPLLEWAVDKDTLPRFILIVISSRFELKLLPWKRDTLLFTQLMKSWPDNRIWLHPVCLGYYLQARWIVSSGAGKKELSDLDCNFMQKCNFTWASAKVKSDTQAKLKNIISKLGDIRVSMLASTGWLISAIKLLISSMDTCAEPDLD